MEVFLIHWYQNWRNCWWISNKIVRLKKKEVEPEWMTFELRKTPQRYTKMTSANGVEPRLRAVIGLSNVVSEFKGHPRRLTLRIRGNRRPSPFYVHCMLRRRFGGNCQYCDKWEFSWYNGTKIEEIDDELVIKLSVWKIEVEIGDLTWEMLERERMDREKKLFY